MKTEISFDINDLALKFALAEEAMETVEGLVELDLLVKDHDTSWDKDKIKAVEHLAQEVRAMRGSPLTQSTLMGAMREQADLGHRCAVALKHLFEGQHYRERYTSRMTMEQEKVVRMVSDFSEYGD